jgi:hypothetical protein
MSSFASSAAAAATATGSAALRATVDLSRSGSYKQRIRPRTHGKCTARAGYHAFGEQLGRSRVLRFKT